ncbi:MAG: hypothetical protein E7172_03220 [Firmicutes bacterium]|nr:hypothetical protein [Bacillota bacterium]
MNCIIPFTKDIKFNTNIAEIVSISLEHDHTVNEKEILGNFTITGEYKTHEVSINKENFEYVLPFSVNITKPIDIESVDFAIEDFTYEIIDSEVLKVDIEYSIKAIEIEENRDLFDEVEENEELEELIEKLNQEEEIKIIEDEKKDDERNEIEEENIGEEKEMIIEEVQKEEDTFVTYNIHIMKENETIDSVCSTYKTNVNILENYNDLTNIIVGDKIIIPEIDE